MAQWPADYSTAKVLASGYNLKSASVATASNGEAVVVYPQTDEGFQKPVFARFDGGGQRLFENKDVWESNEPISSMNLFPSPGSDNFFLGTAYAARDLTTPLPELGKVQSLDGLSGNGISAQTILNHRYLGGTTLSNGTFISLNFSPTNHTLLSQRHFGPLSPVFTIYNGKPEDVSMVDTSPGSALFSFTLKGDYKESPSRIMLGTTVDGGDNLGAVNFIDEQPYPQSDSQLLKLDSGNYMLTWLVSSDDNKAIQAKTVSSTGVEQTPTKTIMPNVLNYKCATSNLGVPVFAGVSRLGQGFYSADQLFVGLIDPVLGGAQVLPVAVKRAVDIKALQQEPNGDFSLVYSYEENGTNLLKVIRFTGAGGVNWETVVADLGNASEEFLDENPNTWICRAANNGLFIATRHDEIRTTSKTISMVRLRADGQLGNDSLQKPTNFTSPIAATGNVQLQWDDNSDSENSYLVGKIGPISSAIIIVASLPANTTTYTDTTAEDQVHYQYYVSPYNSVTGEYSLSDPLDVTPGM